MHNHDPSRVLHIVTRTYRRPYKKSTTGCGNCKTRKIKCDEVRPVCGNCQRRFTDNSCCKYTSSIKTKSSSSGNSSSGTFSPLQRSLSIRPASSNDANLLELHLMHHYTKITCFRRYPQTMACLVPSLPYSAFEFDIPQIAFSSDIVLNVLFALSALTLVSLNPTDKSWAVASRHYFGRAVVKQRAAIDSMDDDNAEPLFLTAVLLAHYNWLSTHELGSTERYKVDITTYRLCQASKLMAQNDAPWVSKYYSQDPIPTTYHQNGVMHDTGLIESVLQDMQILCKTPDDKTVHQKDTEVYEKVADDIIASYYLLAAGCDNSVLEQRVVTILHRVPQPYVRLLETQQPIAMALWARNTSILLLLEEPSAWWIHGAGEEKVGGKAVMGIFSLMPAEYIWTMDWPLKVLSNEIKLCRDGVAN